MKTKLILTALLVNSVVAFAQQDTSTVTLSIQQAIETGLNNRYDAQSKQYDVTIANSEVQKYKKEWLPEISGTGNMRYSPKIQATYVPGGFFSDEPTLVGLGAKSLAIFGLDLNQPLYKPGLTTDIKLAQNNAAITQERVREEENSIKEQITYAYLNVLLKELQSGISASEEQRFREYMQLAEGKFRLGTMIETDYLKAKLDYENAKVESQKAKQNYELALVNVKYQINIPAETKVVLTDTINSNHLNLLSTGEEGGVNTRTEIRQLKLKQESDKLELQKVRQQVIPTISLYGNYSRQFTYNTLEYTLPQWWSSFSYVGLKISVPITSNFKNHNNLEEARTRVHQTSLDLQQKTADVNYEIRKAQTELANAQQNMQTTNSNYELSKVIYENQKKQYALGAKQYNDLLETNRSLNQAEQNYIKAVYDYLVANVTYQKAIGLY